MNVNTKRALALIGTEIVLAASVGISGHLGLRPSVAYADPDEDSSSWDCRTDGNRICGPGNDTGVAAGCYGRDGVLIAFWPCITAESVRKPDTPHEKGRYETKDQS